VLFVNGLEANLVEPTFEKWALFSACCLDRTQVITIK
jgi:hypothetical protein